MENSIKTNFLFIAILVLIGLFSSCIYKDNDVFNKFEKGSKLTYGMLNKTDQIFLLDTVIVLLVRTNKSDFSYAKHLLFYDKNLYLFSATYLPSNKIDSIKDGGIFCGLNEYAYQKRNLYRNILPLNLKFHFTNLERSTIIFHDKIVTKIEIDSNNLDVTLTFIYPNDKENFFIHNDEKKSIKEILKLFNKTGSFTYPLSNLLFDYDNKKIEISESNNNKLKIDSMNIADENILNNFYSKLWKILEKKINFKE